MRPQPLHDRVLGALALAPMSLRGVSRVLCADYEAVRKIIEVERETGGVVARGVAKPRTGRPAVRYGLADCRGAGNG